MPGASEALGERLRAAREARGLSLSDVADQIRIRTVYLSAIEDENWSMIGAPVYIRGFIRTYARFVGLDPEEAVAAFNRTQPAGGAPQAAGAREDVARDEEGGRRGSLLIWIAATVAVLLIAFVVYNELTMRRSQVVASAASPTPSGAPATATPGSPAPSPTARPAGPAAGAELARARSQRPVVAQGYR